MLAVVAAATLHGLEGRLIRVEVDVAPGLPGFTIVGLPDTAMQEARERVRGAIRNAGYDFPARRITVNLAPAGLRKSGAALDLAMALGILLGSEQVRSRVAVGAVIGELSLGGEVRSVPGILPMVAALARRGVDRVIVPAGAVDEANLIDRIEVLAAASLLEATTLLRAGRGRRGRPAMPRVSLGAGGETMEPGCPSPVPAVPDLAEVRGQGAARFGLEIALAGGHGLLLVGPPGVGKTLLARTIPGLLPPLDDDAALAATVVASAAGDGPISALERRPPFRAPHHTLSYAAMVGGGQHLRPGEITRADHGVLFLDELAEFDRDVLEALRQPLEEGRVTIARAGGVVTFPARFQLVAAMNPCPCGMAGSSTGVACTCPPTVVDRYARRVSGPLRDRLDLWIAMPPVAPAELVTSREPEPSSSVAERIAAVRARAMARNGEVLNGRLRGRVLRRVCRLSPAASHRLIQLGETEAASGRGTERLLRVARTIADLSGAEVVEPAHLDQAAWFHRPGEGADQALAS